MLHLLLSFSKLASRKVLLVAAAPKTFQMLVYLFTTIRLKLAMVLATPTLPTTITTGTSNRKTKKQRTKMKKFAVSAMAIAAVAFSMTSCNKEEAAVLPSITPIFAHSEVMDMSKAYLSSGDTVYLEQGDRVVVYDSRKKAANYTADIHETGVTFLFAGHHDPLQPMDITDDNLYCFYPTELVYNELAYLPMTQKSNGGKLSIFPMYGHGSQNHFVFENLYGLLRMNLKSTSTTTIDSIAINTNKKVNGCFTATLTSGNTLSVTESGVRNNGSNTNVVAFNGGLEINATEATQINILMPENTYDVFDITIFAGTKVYEMRTNNAITISRTEYTIMDHTMDVTKMRENIAGTTNAKFNCGANQIMIAKGNMQFMNYKHNVWVINNNGFNALGSTQVTSSWTVENQSRDIFAWGAAKQSWTDPTGINWIFATNNRNGYAFDATHTTLDGTYKNNIASKQKYNADNTQAWKVPTTAEWTAILADNDNAIVTLNFGSMVVTGLAIKPVTGTLTLTEGATLTKAEWNNYEKQGYAFLPIYNYRASNANVNYVNLNVNGTSKYWASDAIDENNANALVIDANGAAVASTTKSDGCFIRPIIVVE